MVLALVMLIMILPMSALAEGEYKVTINDSANGTVAADKKDNLSEGDEVKLTVTADDGYELDSLQVKDSENNKVTLEGTKFKMPASDVTVTATFKAVEKTYTVTFVDGQGNTLKSETVKEGEAATAPADPTREGYTFDGWDKSFDNITADTTVTAKWKKNEVTYTVTFVDGQGNTLKSETVKEGEAATAPADPTREGYTFDGWDKSFDNITADTTVTAKWKKNEVTYTVTFVDGQGNTLKSETVKEGEAATAPADPTREGYTFDGWDKSFDNITADTTVTAKWKENAVAVETVTVSFDANGGSGTMAAVTVEKGKSYKLPECTFTAPEGKEFDKWSDGTVGTTITVNDNVTIKAQWKDKTVTPKTYTVTFDSNGGSSVASQTVKEGEKATKPADPTKTGYTFGGWQLDGSAYGFDAAVTKDLTLKATWTEVKAPKLVAEGGTYAYDGKAHSVTAKVENGEGYSIEYSTDGKTWSATSPSQTKAGKLTVKVRALKSGAETLTAEATVEVTAKDVSIITIVNCKNCVNVRKGASSSTAKIGTANKGTKYELLGVEGKWYKIQYTKDKVGYVFADYVETGKGTPTDDEPEPATPDGKIVTIANCKVACNVRKGGSQSTTKIGTAPVGEKYQYLGKSGNYYKIQYTASTVGYVHKKYAKISDGSVTPDPEPVTPTGNQIVTIVNCKLNCNVRKSGSQSAKKIGIAPRDKQYQYLGKSGNYYKIQYTKDTVGYVHKNYAKISSGSVTPDKDSKSEGQATIVNCKTMVNIRKEASDTSKILGTVKKGATVIVVKVEGNWTRIKYNGGEAYIFSKYVKVG